MTKRVRIRTEAQKAAAREQRRILNLLRADERLVELQRRRLKRQSRKNDQRRQLRQLAHKENCKQFRLALAKQLKAKRLDTEYKIVNFFIDLRG